MHPKIKKALQDPYYACSLLLDHIGRYVSDEHFVKWSYYLRFRKKLDLKNPKTYNEKLQWLKLYDRHEEYTQMVDKYEAKEYVASIIGEEYIIPTLGVYNSFDDIDFDLLPDQFILKCTHDSGGISICTDKKTFDYKKAKKLFTRNLKRNPFWYNREYPYKNIKPRIIAEKYMEDESGWQLKDYKVFCFNGEPQFVEVDYDRYVGHKLNVYSLDWKFLDFYMTSPNDSSVIIPKPKCLNKMIDFAKTLSSGLVHIRVDFYSIGEKLYFGELTFTPGSGLINFHPAEYDALLGSKLLLPYEKQDVQN
jgi:hypothetical protein